MVLDSQVQNPLDLQGQHALTIPRSTGAPGFLQTQGQRAEADNAWPHPHGTVRATQQSGRTRQKPDGPSPK